MDMVNDGKDIHLDTPQAVKEALASGKDLYNPQTGEFWWEYNYTGSIANTYATSTTRTCWRSSTIPTSTYTRTSWAG